MTEEEKQAETARLEVEKAQADADFETSIESLSDEEKEAKRNEREAPKVDYEALLKEEQEKRKEAERILAEKRFKEAEAKRKKEEGQEDDEDKPLTKRELQDILANERQAIQKDSQEGTALIIARANTGSEAEAQLALLRWKDIKSSGNLEADVLFAIGGINSKRILAQNAELKRSLQSKENSNKDTTGTYRNPTSASEGKMSGDDAQAYKQAGFIWDGQKKVYKKSLSKDGKLFLFKDPKTKKTWTERVA